MARLLSLLLPSLGPDGTCAGLFVVAVDPDPDASRLRVRVALLDQDGEAGPLLARLEAARGYLRAQVAAGVHRRRAPDLVFVLDSCRGAQ